MAYSSGALSPRRTAIHAAHPPMAKDDELKARIKPKQPALCSPRRPLPQGNNCLKIGTAIGSGYAEKIFVRCPTCSLVVLNRGARPVIRPQCGGPMILGGTRRRDRLGGLVCKIEKRDEERGQRVA